jgi:hypothetical protein
VASSSFRVIHVDVLNQLLHIMKMQYRKWVSYLVSLAEEPGGINSIVSWPAVSGGSENNFWSFVPVLFPVYLLHELKVPGQGNPPPPHVNSFVLVINTHTGKRPLLPERC